MSKMALGFPKITVLMPVYNGEAYLEEQVASILNQQGVTVRLVASDDCSSDGSLAILRAISKADPRLEIVANDCNLGLVRTLAKLFGRVDPKGGYIALADQDDVWDSHKLASSINALEAFGASLVYSDVRIIDADGGKIAPTYLKLNAIRPVEGRDPVPFVFRNPAIGHTIVSRAELAPMMARMPVTMLFHEPWLIAVAAQNGEIKYLDETLGSYRQHATNVLGAKAKFLSRLTRLFGKNGTIHRRQKTRTLAIQALATLDSRLVPIAELTARRGIDRIFGLPRFAMFALRLSRKIGLGPALTEIVLFPFGGPIKN